ncbi:MAG: secondary thiamine-phosphate synthase enzyme YjbQ [Methylobacteriaceae bacterium]|nr:secondary thiamine-phosphate synthase enzyme YjbQ [Methylobacteriaceae bacterium]
MTITTLHHGPVTRQATGRLTVTTQGGDMVPITGAVQDWVKETGIRNGLLTCFCQHTSASLTIQENTDPDVRLDLMDALERLASTKESYRHSLEGSDDMPAHIRTSLTDTTLSVPVLNGRALFGVWQGLYVLEHRSRSHQRIIILQLTGT